MKKLFTLAILSQLALSTVTFAQTKVVAHRGAWKNTGAPENSIASLKAAIKMGCDGSEFDVHMSADSVLFINHDAHIQELPIETTSSTILSNLKLKNGEAFPTLKEYLKEGIKQKRTRLVLEIKPSAISKERGIALTRKVVDMVNSMKAASRVDYISFDYDICKEITKIAPKATVQYLNGDKTPDELLTDGIHGFDYNLKILDKNPSWIKEAKSKKLITNAWTVNDEKSMDWLLTEDIGLITTNEPELLLKKVHK
ncbi:glycerophosphodiester phosphodiesterase [Pedobacter sp. JCM 36344]|uniref:glycerophosphodiester phosphodiesterase n=1 Tax=Pedobacter sp. JCM 36344 TaxID=3374280 RepID=UPI00397E6AD8